ncbi:hypothetical protein [Streptomyces sp. NBC_00654]|uniref:hypothetical protein n=1 Tax=Streptomyces sp. NBC_00654 TaxID=2975799 RepID=UPI00224E68FA|nr:hypothetical protein [Streptomyces sp. NBC_00654]MCX4967029.1 hypothetical protein [Streptomyces sp. NBC_00654]
MKRTLGLIAAVAGLGLGSLIGPASAASASPATTAESTTAHRSQAAGPHIMQIVDRVNVPKCVKFKTDFSGATDHLYITNKCKSAKRVRVILDYGPDFKCTKIGKGYRGHYTWPYPSKVNKVKGC